jgi:hypothetical protein
VGILKVLEIVSIIATIAGLYLLGEKIALGFIVFTISLICQAVIFYKNKNWVLIFKMLILVVFNIYNYFKWIGGI